MNEITSYEDLFEALSGVDDKKMPKAIFGLQKELISGEENIVETYDEIVFDNAILTITVNGDYIIVDADFTSPMDMNFKLCWNFLESFYRDLREKELTEDQTLHMVAVFIPEENQNYSLLSHSFISHGMISKEAGKPVHIIRMVFHAEGVVGGDFSEAE